MREIGRGGLDDVVVGWRETRKGVGGGGDVMMWG